MRLLYMSSDCVEQMLTEQSLDTENVIMSVLDYEWK